jgi:hypothetical protein
MTDEEFEELYELRWRSCGDRDVAEIPLFGHASYSHTRLCQKRSTLHPADDPQVCEVVRRCCLFLQTDQVYEWPTFPSDVFARISWSFAMGLGIPLGVALLVVGLAMAMQRFPEGIPWFLSGGFLLIASCLFIRFWNRRFRSSAWHEYWSSGDPNAWPFLHHESRPSGLAQAASSTD